MLRLVFKSRKGLTSYQQADVKSMEQQIVMRQDLWKCFLALIVTSIFLSFPCVSRAASYNSQSITATAFDTTTTNVIWSNDSGLTGFPTDDDFQEVSIGFTFPFGSVNYTTVRILANGALHFGADQGFYKDYTNEALPITGDCNDQGVSCPGVDEAADRTILVYWDDLEPSAGGTVTYDTLGTSPNQRFVVTWDSLPLYNQPTTSYSLQVVLYENGSVLFRYGNDDIDGGGASATIGMEVSDTDFTELSFNTAGAVSDAADILWNAQFPNLTGASADCADLNTVTVTFDDAVPLAVATDTSYFSLDNGATVSAVTVVDSSTLALTTSNLSSTTTYTLSMTNPTQATTFTPTAGNTTVTYADTFSSQSYGNNNGSGLWTSDWEEADETAGGSGPTAGNITITSNQLRLDDNPNTGLQPALSRQIDLSLASSAILTFDYSTSNNLENGDRFDISVSSDGGANYTVLTEERNDVSGSASFDISAFLSATTRIRFRISQGYGGGNEALFIDNVQVSSQEPGICPVPTLDHFRVLHDNFAINCRPETVTVYAEDASNVVIDDYTGSVTLSTSTGNGTWTLTTGAGTFADATADDGAATYTFADADDGIAIFTLSNTNQESLNVQVSDGSVFDEDSEGLLTFRPFGFDFSPNPISTQIANQPFTLTLFAAGEIPSDTNCGVIEEYTGVKSLFFWSSYSEPSTGVTSVTVDGNAIATSEAAATSQNVTFTNGVANISINYADAGRIGLSVRDDNETGDPPTGAGNEFIGGLSPFVVRPFAFYIEVEDNPDASTATGTVFRRAGQSFLTTIKAVNYQASDDPNINADLADNSLTPNFSQHGATVSVTLNHSLQAPIGGQTGTLTGSGSLIDFNDPSNGEKQVTLSFDEVGIITLQASIADYLSSGEGVLGTRANVGRFIPDNFLIDTLTQSASCGSFSYGGFISALTPSLNRVGQGFSTSGTIIARNASNATTANYTGTFGKLNNTNISAQAIDGGSAAPGNLNFSVASTDFSLTNGVATFLDDETNYQFASESAPFDLVVRIAATDSDGVTSVGTNFDTNAIEQRFGRARLENAYGPEAENLRIGFYTEFFDGSQYQTNTLDNCTTYNGNDITLANYADNLSSGETSIIGPLVATSVSSGRESDTSPILLSAPGIGNEGSVELTLDLSLFPWLARDNDGNASLDNPQANITFGRFRGSDRVIFWQEL